MATRHSEVAVRENKFIRGMQFPQPATDEARLLVRHIALAIGVEAVWARGNLRLDVIGPRVAVDWFVESAALAQSLVSQPTHTSFEA
jgi:hypothetical protein